MSPSRSLTNKATLTIAAVAAAIWMVVGAPPARSEPDDSVAAYLNEWMAANQVPGVAVALIDGQEVSVHVAGTDGDGQPITEESAFLIGSVAKTFTSTMVLGLVDQGVIGLDDPVSQHLDTYGHDDVTVRDLLAHTAGYTAADGMAVSERYDNAPGALQRAVADLERTGTPGQYAYTSADYLVLGALIESVTGEQYGEYLEQSILSPQGMSHTGGTTQAATDLPPGHRLWFGHPRAYDPGFDESGAPYGYLVSTGNDLATYARAHLDGALIPEALTETAWSIQNSTGTDRGYGLGWSIADVDGVPHLGHRGATPGYFADLLIVPAEDRAVVVLANSYSEAKAPSLAGASEDLYHLMTVADAEIVVQQGDPLLAAAPWMGAGIAVLGAAIAAVSWRRPVGRRRRVVSAAVALTVAVALAAVPTLLGYTPRTLWIWTLDIAVSLAAAVVAWLAAAGVLLLRLRTMNAVAASGEAATSTLLVRRRH